jgi:hypothetical protein
MQQELSLSTGLASTACNCARMISPDRLAYPPEHCDEARIHAAIASGDEDAINLALLDALYSDLPWQQVEAFAVEAARRFQDLVEVQFRYLQNVEEVTAVRVSTPHASMPRRSPSSPQRS